MLFLTAGVTWIFDVLSWASSTSSSENQGTPWYWIFFDLVNILQAIVIFIIFVCNPQTLTELQQEVPCLSSKRFESCFLKAFLKKSIKIFLWDFFSSAEISKLWSSKLKGGADLSRKISQTQISNVAGVCDDLELK